MTRSEPGAQRSAKALAAMGYDALALPLLRIGPPSSPPPSLPENAVLVITSQNGLWALITETKKRDFPVICVGDATANLAGKLGFTQVFSASGTSQDILPLIAEKFKDDNRPFVHISGETVIGSLSADLSQRGYEARRHIYYSSSPIASLSDLNPQDVQTVLMYSPKGAAALRGLALNTSHMRVISISHQTDAALGGMTFKRRHIAAAPNEAAMFTMLD